jgi:pimeloyl-ACP methyl ester carboxylesterase
MRYVTSVRWTLPILLLVLAAGLLVGCSEEAVSPESDQAVASVAGRSAPVANIIEGEVGPGTEYALCMPDNWNGDLIVYAHGFIDVAVPIGLPTECDWEYDRDALLAEGYAIAYSSFSCNGFSVKEGVQQTHQVRGLFIAEYGEPEYTYLMGHSLGGAVGVVLAEKHPGIYDGVLSMSGMIGGSMAQIDYVANVRILFDTWYPGVLPGTVVDIPDITDLYGEVVIPIATAIQTTPDYALAIGQLDQTPVPFSNGEELVQSFAQAIGFNFRGFNDVASRTHGHCPVDNMETVYSCSMGTVPASFLDATNAMVPRYDRTPDADAYLRHYMEPTGELTVPMLTLHHMFDPSVPIFHEDIYEALVAASGHSDNFVRRTVFNPHYGHCSYGDVDTNVATVTAAFLDLVNWVEYGVKPTP